MDEDSSQKSRGADLSNIMFYSDAFEQAPKDMCEEYVFLPVRIILGESCNPLYKKTLEIIAAPEMEGSKRYIDNLTLILRIGIKIIGYCPSEKIKEIVSNHYDDVGKQKK